MLRQEDVNEFHIPADADDTFVNIGLGSLLHKYKDHDTAYSKWLQANPHISTAIINLLNYSYQPFGDTFDNRIIDPRSYFYLRNFLYKSENLRINNLKLPATWMMSFNENVLLYDKQVRMPFNLNNVDLTVSANVLYGLTAAVLSDLDNPELWFDADVQMLYQSIVDMIIYELQSNLSSRPDLALTYYPSKFVFYWIMSRTLQLLKSSDRQIMYAVMEEASRDLETLLRSNFTDTLIKLAVHDEYGLAYYDEFLGDDDKDLFGNMFIVLLCKNISLLFPRQPCKPCRGSYLLYFYGSKHVTLHMEGRNKSQCDHSPSSGHNCSTTLQLASNLHPVRKLQTS